MKLSHFSWKRIDGAYSVAQHDELASKPKGLWVSVDGDDDWPSFCKREDFRDVDTQAHYRVHLAEGANIRYIRTPNALLKFDKEFGDKDIVSQINWARVAEKYQGIIIAPYQWSMRLGGPHWYYTWDVASGCLWDKDAVKSIELVRRGSKSRKSLGNLADLLTPETLPIGRQEIQVNDFR